MKTKPYGIFEVFDDSITISELEKTLNRFSNLVELCYKGHESEIWTWEENFTQIANYIQIMKNELKSLSTLPKANDLDECTFCAGTGYPRGEQCIDIKNRHRITD